ncbi:MAG: hypothetical protein HQK57_05410 [Deltaproteobacteria bacterium]|nr:hypothetical protein [Deltaproteobacteria bacterium]MBF0524888.1 hypothetical protein [Deltaproteobacteria bacterium]
MKKSIFVLSVLLFVSGLFLPVCQAGSPWTGCVIDSSYPNTKYNYIVEQVGTGTTAYATIRGTVVNTAATQDAFPGTMDGYIQSSTSDIHFTITYRNNWGSRFYVLYRAGGGLSWAVDANGNIYDQPHAITIKDCPAGDDSGNRPLNDLFNLDQGNR